MHRVFNTCLEKSQLVLTLSHHQVTMNNKQTNKYMQLINKIYRIYYK